MTEIPQDRYEDRLDAWEELKRAKVVAGPEGEDDGAK